ncbi:MAG: T9SS type A sorting domain-containing protein [Bacteroidota bacterium]
MKTFFSLTVFLSTIFFSDAQITLTRANLPSSGTVMIPRFCYDSLPGAGPSGANVTWDFSILEIDYGFTVPKNYTQMAGYSNLFYWQSSGFYAYGEQFHADSTTYNQTGESNYSSNPIPHGSGYRFLDDIVRIPFPFTYNDFFLDSFYFDYYSESITDTTHYYGPGHDSTIADGWGTLIMPFGSYNALRIYYNDVYLDTNYAGGYTMRTEEGYDWYVENYIGPVLTDQLNQGNHNFTFYVNPLQPISVNEIAKGAKPNCYSIGNGRFEIRFQDGKVHQLKSIVTDMAGKKLIEEEKKSVNQKLEVNLSGFKDGIYLLTLFNSTERNTFKLAMVR